MILTSVHVVRDQVQFKKEPQPHFCNRLHMPHTRAPHTHTHTCCMHTWEPGMFTTHIRHIHLTSHARYTTHTHTHRVHCTQAYSTLRVHHTPHATHCKLRKEASPGTSPIGTLVLDLQLPETMRKEMSVYQPPSL